MNIFSLIKFMSDENISSAELENYQYFGEGIGALYDGYSLFTPPHGLESFGGFSNWWYNFTNNPYCENCASFADLFFGGVNGFLWFFIILFLILIFILKIKLNEVGEIMRIKHDIVYEKSPMDPTAGKDGRWKTIQYSINSENINDWKTAIIDADNLLDETLQEHGYNGETLGERLKNANFATVQNAWAAHIIRNKIAHDSSFILTKRETKRALQNYKIVFSEFYYI